MPSRATAPRFPKVFPPTATSASTPIAWASCGNTRRSRPPAPSASRRSIIRARDSATGVFFDVFARTSPQAEAMRNSAVQLEPGVGVPVPDAVIIERMSGRRCRLPSGRTYHLRHNPPKNDLKDDVTGEALVQRDDDKEETVKKRLAVYHAQTEPLIGYYDKWFKTGDRKAPKYHRVDGIGGVDGVRDRVFAALR